jgi:enoyl-CoA hydratase/carnithine racemase
MSTGTRVGESPEVVLRERRGPVEIVTINRPQASNAINGAATRALDDAFTMAAQDPGISVVILTAAGKRAFCAGMDFRSFLDGAPESDFLTENGFGGITHRDFPKPLIGAINGAALGGGLELVLACDLVVASESATFGIPELKVGHLADAGALIWLAKRIPFSVAMEMALTGDAISARRAKEVGLINSVVDHRRLIDNALELAQRIHQNAPVSVRLSKRILRESLRLPEAEVWPINASAREEVMRTEDSIEGVRAFLEKRRPLWKGR